ncbi:FAD:protein FMN transferase [Mycetocola sp. JXN-3]|uniref:FAD:protein FMN transferase n=1 Tax=Mycetocola sp. JXN-3 TaxID=2116510 RepID=UPI00165D2807|nr:FAD:protein FMN transferase [Mycetocola sp. JXN-3]
MVPAPAPWRFEAIGTGWQITTENEVSPGDRATVSTLIDAYDAVYSRFRADSLVRGFAQTGGSVDLGAHWPDLWDTYVDLEDLTAGAVTPLVGRALETLGYDAAYSLIPSGIPGPVPALGDTLRSVGTVVTTTEPVLLDVGAVGKGQLVDLVVGLLMARGYTALTVDAGGDIRHAGSSGLRVALEHPFDPTRAIGVIELAGSGPRGAIAGSATNRRAWGEGLHHVLDGRTGKPVDSIVATWAIGESALIADAAATALFFAGPEAVATRLDVDWVRMFTNGRVEFSRTLPGEVFIA